MTQATKDALADAETLRLFDRRRLIGAWHAAGTDWAWLFTRPTPADPAFMARRAAHAAFRAVPELRG